MAFNKSDELENVNMKHFIRFNCMGYILIVAIIYIIYMTIGDINYHKSIQTCNYYNYNSIYDNLYTYNCTLYYKCDTTFDCIINENLSLNSSDVFMLYIYSKYNTTNEFYINDTACTDVNDAYVINIGKNYAISIFIAFLALFPIILCCMDARFRMEPKKIDEGTLCGIRWSD